MSIDSIRLQKFRLYRDAGFEFEPGVNIIVGPNASGKTSLLEALLVACRGDSFRGRDNELMAFGAPWARLDAFGSGGERTVKLMRQNHDVIKKEFVVDQQKLSRLHLSRTVPIVLFEPNHLLLLHGPPEARRDYLDNLIEQTISDYGGTRRAYRRILAQRNALLKRDPAKKDELFAWNVRLSETGAQVAHARAQLVKTLNDEVDDLYGRLAGVPHSAVDVAYEPMCDLASYSSQLLKLLEDRQDRDLERGFTTVGPHREDMVITLNGREAAVAASRGETRTILLALKIMELNLIEQAREQRPLLLLDDVFSELDGKRRQALTHVLTPYQTFITTTDADVILHHFTDQCHMISLE